jgi:hypothetical protein
MRALFRTLLALSSIVIIGTFQLPAAGQSAPARQANHAGPPSKGDTGPTDGSEEIQQLKLELQRMQTLLNQMRSNLAFVQTSQTPLKHQFELEADAWQVMVEQMQRRLQRMEDRGAREPKH